SASSRTKRPRPNGSVSQRYTSPWRLVSLRKSREAGGKGCSAGRRLGGSRRPARARPGGAPPDGPPPSVRSTRIGSMPKFGHYLRRQLLRRAQDNMIFVTIPRCLDRKEEQSRRAPCSASTRAAIRSPQRRQQRNTVTVNQRCQCKAL